MGGDNTGAAELAFHQVLGAWGAIRSIFALSLLDHQIDRNEGYITDVAVLGPYRRRGVAQALLARAEEDARLRRKRFLGLYVSAANHAARRAVPASRVSCSASRCSSAPNSSADAFASTMSATAVCPTKTQPNARASIGTSGKNRREACPTAR
jgi:hypothetical protein